MTESKDFDHITGKPSLIFEEIRLFLNLVGKLPSNSKHSEINNYL